MNRTLLKKIFSFLLVISIVVSIFSFTSNKAKAAGRSVTLTPAEIAATTNTDVSITYTTSATQYANTNTIVFTASPALSNAITDCASPDTDADNDATPDGAFGSFSTTSATYTFTAATTVATTTGINLCLRFNTAQGSYSIAFGDTGNDGDYGAALLYVGDDNDVTVTATVDPNLSFNIRALDDLSDTNSCPLGTVSPSSPSPDGDVVDDGAGECGYALAIGTNAGSGFQAQIDADAALNFGGVSITDIAEDGAITAGTESYGLDFIAPATTGRNSGTGAYDQTITKNGNFSDDDTPVPTAATNFVSYTGGIQYVAGTNALDTTRVVHGLAVGSGTPAGSYDQLVTYTVTATF